MIKFPTRIQMMQTLCPPGSKLCEIGVFTGDFANQLLGLRPSTLVLIDPFVGKVFSGDVDGNNGKEVYLPAAYIQLVQAVSKAPNVMLLRGYSQEMLPLFPPGLFDAIYIDGDHSYSGVKRDLELAWRVVKDGGFICGHDYEMNPEKTKNRYDFGVKQAVDEFIDSKGLMLTAKAFDGQVSYAIKKDMMATIRPYIDTKNPPFYTLKKGD